MYASVYRNYGFDSTKHSLQKSKQIRNYQVVKQYVYLGDSVSNEGEIVTCAIKKRWEIDHKKQRSLQKTWQNSDMTWTQAKNQSDIIVSNPPNGAEMWRMKAQDRKRICWVSWTTIRSNMSVQTVKIASTTVTNRILVHNTWNV